MLRAPVTRIHRRLFPASATKPPTTGHHGQHRSAHHAHHDHDGGPDALSLLPSQSFFPLSTSRSGGVSQWLSWTLWRSWVLHHLAPFDKSVWACARTRLWWALNGIGFIPTVNHVWWLIVLVMKDKSDEYQLCDFIVGVEAARFFR